MLISESVVARNINFTRLYETLVAITHPAELHAGVLIPRFTQSQTIRRIADPSDPPGK